MVRAYIENNGSPDFLYAESEEIPHMIEFWGILEGYRRKGFPLEISYGSGVQDRTGEEIYEGDLMKVYYEQESEEGSTAMVSEVGYVIFSNGEFCIINEDGMDLPLSDGFECEIIGTTFHMR